MQLPEEFEPSLATIASWLKQVDLDDGARTVGRTTEERDELRRLRREAAREIVLSGLGVTDALAGGARTPWDPPGDRLQSGG